MIPTVNKMPTSKYYKCRRCGVYLEMEAEYFIDEDYGDQLKVIARCPRCGDANAAEIDLFQPQIEGIANVVGTEY